MRHPGGWAISGLLGGGVVAAVPLVGIRWLDTSNGLGVALQSLGPLTGAAVGVLMVGAVVTRRWRISAVAGVLLTVCAASAAPTLISHTVAPGRDDIVVMSANLRYGGADAQSLVNAVRQRRVDVLVLVEVTPDAVERLAAAGLDTVLPESLGRPRPGAQGVLVRGRLLMRLVDPGLNRVSVAGADQPVVSVHLSTGDVMLRAVHPLAPLLTGASEWRSGLADLQAWLERQPPGRRLIVAGDFNSSWGHPAFRGVAQTLTDAHRAAGQGWVRTWPYGRRLLRPFIQLDHVLVRGLGVVDAGLVPLPNTDHAAVWTRLSVHAR